MNKGKCVITGTLDELRKKTNVQTTIQVGLVEVTPSIVLATKSLGFVKKVEVNSEQAILNVSVDDACASTPEIVSEIVAEKGRVLSVNVLQPSLEETYLKLIQEEQV
jgi:ABC-type multidrug transport system ATPase subunit